MLSFVIPPTRDDFKADKQTYKQTTACEAAGGG